MTAGKPAAGIAGTTSAGSMGVLAEALASSTASHTAPACMWVVMAVLITVTTAVAWPGPGLPAEEARDRVGGRAGEEPAGHVPSGAREVRGRPGPCGGLPAADPLRCAASEGGADRRTACRPELPRDPARSAMPALCRTGNPVLRRCHTWTVPVTLVSVSRCRGAGC